MSCPAQQCKFFFLVIHVANGLVSSMGIEFSIHAVQVELAQSEYQLPRLTRMWTHLERQAGGRVRGMGEKQIEVDKRLLRTRMGQLRRNLEEVRTHRKQYRERRAQVLSWVFCLQAMLGRPYCEL